MRGLPTATDGAEPALPRSGDVKKKKKKLFHGAGPPNKAQVLGRVEKMSGCIVLRMEHLAQSGWAENWGSEAASDGRTLRMHCW